MVRKHKIIVLTILILSTLSPIAYLYVSNLLPFVPFNRQLYVDMITELKSRGYTFVLPRDYISNCIITDTSITWLNWPKDCNNKIAIIVHDVDYNTNGVNTFIDIETKYNIRSAFYLRPDGTYFTQNIKLFQQLQLNGWEIGYHYDVLSRSNGNYFQAQKLFNAQLSYMQSFFNISTTRAHGDEYNLKIPNIWFYNSTIWASFGLRDFSNLDASWISDTNHILTYPSSYGNVVVIELHSDWWS